MESNMTSSMTPPAFLSPGTTALVTGGASGIGLAFARLCHEKYGMKIALVDIDAAALQKARDELLSPSASTNNPSAANGAEAAAAAPVHTYTVDVADIEQWRDLKAKVEMDMGLVGVLMLNAGTATDKTPATTSAQGIPAWEETSKFAHIISTNYLGVINGISTFLPSLRSQQKHHYSASDSRRNSTGGSSGNSSLNTAVIITGSKQGITNPPGNPAYNASKAAVRSVAEHLSYDLRGTSTAVHLLVPGWTHTGMTRRPAAPSAGGSAPNKYEDKPGGAWWPRQVATYLEQSMLKGEFYVICPDGDVDEQTDRKRILWNTGDVLHRRPPLSRWREGYKDDAARWMETADVNI